MEFMKTGSYRKFLFFDAKIPTCLPSSKTSINKNDTTPLFICLKQNFFFVALIDTYNYNLRKNKVFSSYTLAKAWL